MALLTLTGCSGTGSRPSPTVPPLVTTTTAPASTTTTIETAEAIAAYETCLADSGIEIEPIPVDATGRPRLELVMRTVDFSDPEIVGGLTECADRLTSGALDLRDNPALLEEVRRQLAEFSGCVRSRGVPEFPDPIESFAGVGTPFWDTEIPFDDPDLDAAVDACSDRLR